MVDQVRAAGRKQTSAEVTTSNQALNSEYAYYSTDNESTGQVNETGNQITDISVQKLKDRHREKVTNGVKLDHESTSSHASDVCRPRQIRDLVRLKAGASVKLRQQLGPT